AERGGERNFAVAGARDLGCVHAGFVARVGGDVTARSRGEGENAEMERLARAGESAYVVGFEALLLRKLFAEPLGQPGLVAAGVGGNFSDGIACVGART